MDLERIPTDLRWGLSWGMRIASALSVIAVTVVVIRIAVAGRRDGGSLTLGLMIIVVWYVAGGLVTGSLVGLLRPLGRNRLGAALVGFFAALPLSFATYALLVGPSQFTAPVAIVSVVTALGIGGVAGLIISGDSPHPGQSS